MIATTGKRSAIVITLLVIGIYYFYIIKNRAITNTGMLKGIFILLVVIVFGVWFVNNSTAIQTLIIKANELAKRGDVSNGRFELWKYAIDKWYQHPVLGVGLKKIQSLVGLDVHNTYIQILAETGFIGFIIFIIGIVCICCWAYKIVKNDMTTCTVASRCTIELGFMMVIYLLLYGFVGNTFIDYLPIMLFSVAIVMNFNGKEKLT
jgi:O-antigen ligase